MQPYRTGFAALITLIAVSILGAGSFPRPFLASLTLAQTQDTRKATANQLFQQGIEQYKTKKLEAAVQSWQQAREIYLQIQDRQGEKAALGNMGATYVDLEKYSKAIESLQSFLSIVQATGDGRGRGQSLSNLGIAYKELGDYVKAIESHQQALAIMQAIKDRQGEGKVLVNLGNAYEALGEYDKASELYQQSLTIAREINDRQGEGTALGNKGAVYADRGEYDRALESYQESLAIARSLGDRQGQASTLNNLGVAYHARGNLTQAIEYYQQSLAIAQEIHYQKMEGKALGSLGLAYENLHDYSKAIEYYQQSLAIAQEIKDPQTQALSLNNLGHVLFNTGKLTQAEKKIRMALEILASLRPGSNDKYNVSVFDTQVLTYNLLQQILVAQNRPEAALEISEQARARAFVELLTARLYDSNAQQTNAINSVSTNLLTIQQIQQIAKSAKSTIVEYIIVPDDDFKFQGRLKGLESELYIWVVQPTGKVAFRRIDLKPARQQQARTQGTAPTSLRNLVASSREALGARGRGISVVAKPDAPSAKKQRLQQLHQILIQPIADLLPKDPDARVIFIPQESLFLVPFPALQDAAGKYLVEQHTILTAPAIQVLALTRKQRQRIQGLAHDALVIGNPTMPKIELEPGQPPQQLPSLPGAQQEAVAIASLLHTKAITGNKATKVDMVPQLPKARLVHLATHGLLDDVKKLGVPGAIALAPSGNDSGLLSSSEIINLKLNSELVVLSACDTGRGEITGDGVIGLSRSFISAGAPSVIVSLWSVPDAPTAFLMTEFYRQFQHHPDKAQALRNAMLKTMAEHPDPKDWAAFTLIGEAE